MFQPLTQLRICAIYRLAVDGTRYSVQFPFLEGVALQALSTSSSQ